MTIKTDTVPEGLPLPSGLKELPKPERKMRYFWQGDARYGKDQLGDGPSTVSRGGCLVHAIRSAAIYYGTRLPTEHPGMANVDYLKGHAFSGDNLAMHKAAAIDKLVCPQETRLSSIIPGDPKLKALLEATFAAGKLAVIHVSDDWNIGNGGEHFILAFKVEGDNILCADSALGTSVPIPRKTLQKEVMWKNVKKLYQIVSVAPIWLPVADPVEVSESSVQNTSPRVGNRSNK
jgi:hypothetical protein